MAHCLHQPNQLAFVGGELEMAPCKGATEVSEGSRALVKDGAEPRAQRVAVNHEGRVEVRHLQYRPGGQGALQRLECRRRIVIPCKRVSPQETRERGSDDAEVPDELPIVTRQTQEALEGLGGAGKWPRSHGGDLVGVHGDTALGDDMAQIGH